MIHKLLLLLAIAAQAVTPNHHQVKPLAKRVIIVDAGHGGRDDGASGHGIKESDLVLQAAKDIARELRSLGARVVMTRTTKANMLDPTKKYGNRQRANLAARVALSEHEHADVYLSIHANSYVSYPSARGPQVFIGEKPDEHREHLGICLQRELSAASGTKRQLNKRRDLYLAEHLKIPMALIEIGFLSNPTEAQKMTTDGHRQMIAKAIGRGVVAYYRLEQAYRDTRQIVPKADPAKDAHPVVVSSRTA